MPTTLALSVEYDDDSGYREECARDRFTVRRQIQVAWASREIAAEAFLGKAAPRGNGLINRTLPEFHPSYPNKIATSFSLESLVGAQKERVGELFDLVSGENLADDGRFIATVGYEIPPYAVLPDDQVTLETSEFLRFVEKLPKYSLETYRLPNAYCKFQTTNQVLPEGPVIHRSIQNLTYVWHQVPTIPTQGIEACLGKVNSATFDGNAAETLLCLAPELERVSQADDSWAWQVKYTFLKRSTGWNKLWNRATDSFETVVDKDGNKIYQSESFLKLFLLDV